MLKTVSVLDSGGDEISTLQIQQCKRHELTCRDFGKLPVEAGSLRDGTTCLIRYSTARLLDEWIEQTTVPTATDDDFADPVQVEDVEPLLIIEEWERLRHLLAEDCEVDEVGLHLAMHMGLSGLILVVASPQLSLTLRAFGLLLSKLGKISLAIFTGSFHRSACKSRSFS